MWRISVLLIFLSIGCVGNPPTPQELYGKWKTEDGVVLELSPDNKFHIESLYYKDYNSNFFISRNSEDMKLSGSGNWEIQKNNDDWELKLVFPENDSSAIEGFYTIQLGREINSSWYPYLVGSDEIGGGIYYFEAL